MTKISKSKPVHKFAQRVIAETRQRRDSWTVRDAIIHVGARHFPEGQFHLGLAEYKEARREIASLIGAAYSYTRGGETIYVPAGPHNDLLGTKIFDDIRAGIPPLWAKGHLANSINEIPDGTGLPIYQRLISIRATAIQQGRDLSKLDVTDAHYAKLLTRSAKARDEAILRDITALELLIAVTTELVDKTEQLDRVVLLLTDQNNKIATLERQMELVLNGGSNNKTAAA